MKGGSDPLVEGVIPSPELGLLYRAGLLAAPRGLPAWQAWLATADLDGEVDGPTYRALPLVYKNLGSALGTRHGLLAGIYRRTWYENQWALQIHQDLAAEISLAGVTAVLAGDVALAHVAYSDPGVRHIESVDFLVDEAGFDTVRAVVESRGFKSHDRTRGLTPSISFFAATPVEGLDLRIRIFRLPADMTAVEQIALDGYPRNVPALTPEGYLLEVFENSFRLGRSQWVPDATLLLRKHGDAIDWPRFLSFARTRGLAARVSGALEYLEREYDLPTPPGTHESLADSQSAAWERRVLASGATNGPASITTRVARLLARVAYPMTGEHRTQEGVSRAEALAEAARVIKEATISIPGRWGSRRALAAVRTGLKVAGGSGETSDD